MEEVSYGTSDSLWCSSPSSSSLLWASRLSPLAQPFTMNRQFSAPLSLNSLTLSPSNDLHAFEDLMLPNSLSILIDDQPPVQVAAPACSSPESSLSASAFPFDGRKPREFSDSAGFSQLSLGFCGETGLGGFTFENKTVGNGKGVVSSSEVVKPARGSLVKHDSKMNPLKISAATDSSSSPMFQKQNTLQVPAIKTLVKSLVYESLKNLDDEEEDLDSPCWKGFRNPRKSPSPKPLRNEPEMGPSLNPQAPQFFPSNGKRSSNFSQNIAVSEASSSFRASSNDQKLKEPCNATGYQHSNGIHVPGKEAFMLESSKSRSAIEQIENTSFSGADSINEFSQILQCLSSISRCQSINTSMAVKAVHYMSDLLVQNCDYEPLNGNELKMIHDTIDNLYLFINSRAGQKTPMLTLPQTGHLDYLDEKATHERSNMETQITRSSDLVVRDELDSWRNSNVVNSYSPALTRKMPDHYSLYRDAVSYRDGNVNPALSTTMKENGQANEDFQPRALLNLWIEAQAALCSMKYENNILRMKLGVRSDQ